MGRHAAPEPPDLSDRDRSHGPRPSGPTRWRDRMLLAVVVGVTAGGVAGWASTSWTTAALVAAGAAAVTVVAAWVAGTVPGPP